MALSLLPVLLQNLNSLIQTEVGLLWGVDKDMNKLSSTLSTIQAVLEDAEQKQLREKAIQDWLRKLKHAAYEVDDILDDCATEALRWKSKGQQSSASLNMASTSFLTCFPVENIWFRHKIGTRMKEIIMSLDKIADERNKFHLHEAVVGYQDLFAESRETSSFLTQPELYGRDEEREKIVKVLVDDVCERDEVSVYPVIGIGGLGKTTLAQMVFNDDRVKRHFELKIWVYVSQDFDVKRVIKTIIESASGKACEALDLDSLQRSLRDMLNGKRYLIVLDDVWNEDQEKWDRFKFAVTYGSKGASVIVTTRDKKVASIMATIPPHELSFLSEDDCWWLFRQRAFGRENEECPNLVAIGKEIVKKCGGVPLAAKALGGLLRFKSEESEWLFVKESDIGNLPQDENSILPALRLSYYSLPLELRRCFAYCAVFPKGSRIEKGYLISLWMANGFISCKENLELEDIGERIWNELCWRSFFQVVDNDEMDVGPLIFRNHDLQGLHRIGCLTWFKMHDLVHDLSHSVMEDECQVMRSKSSDMRYNKKFRHVTLACGNDRPVKFHETFHDVASLRTLRQDPDAYGWDMRDFSKFFSLRVFDSRWDMPMNYLPSSIGNLKHLRYLDLSHPQIKQLPNSICTLWNLQTLILTSCLNLKRLPKNMENLISLRRLYLPSHVLVDMPPKIGHLTCLKTLSVFVVGKGKGCHLAELQHLNLEGKLRIEHLERVRNPVDAKEANLVGKQNLSWLELSWEKNAESESQENIEEILEALEPPPNLKMLVIENYRGTLLPRWMRDSILAKIVDIELKNCKNCLQLPPFGQLPLLQRLRISRMDKVEYIDDTFPCGGPVRGFPSLEVLKIYSSPNLKGLSREEGIELLPRLHELKFTDCPNFTVPCLSSLKKLTVPHKCTNALLNSISNLNSLVSLDVADNEEAICFPEDMLRNLASLESLRIKRFTKLKVLPEDLAGLVALKKLYIDTCPELESLPEQGLRGLESLQHLEINLCNKLSSLSEGLQHLTALKILQICGCPELVVLPEGVKLLSSLRHLTFSGWNSDDHVVDAKLVALPDALQHVPSLQTLSILDFPELASLPDWLGNLTSLQGLYIYNCPKIASLPASIQSLTGLESLGITACSLELARRCEMRRGEDWYKIEHILYVSVDPAKSEFQVHLREHYMECGYVCIALEVKRHHEVVTSFVMFTILIRALYQILQPLFLLDCNSIMKLDFQMFLHSDLEVLLDLLNYFLWFSVINGFFFSFKSTGVTHSLSLSLYRYAY